MSFTRTTFIAAIAAVVALACNVSSADTFFRGISTIGSEDLETQAFLGARPDGIMHIDVQDTFDVPGALVGSSSNSFGFVPPQEVRENGRTIRGPLPASLAAKTGLWSGGSDYSVSNGRVSANTAGAGAVSVPWRITEDLGFFYLLDATADVADGETVSLGYFGDVDVTGASDGLAGDLGLLVLNLSRTGTQVDWEVKWEGDVPGSVSGSAGQVALGQDVNLQLGWVDNRRVAGPDLFEAWLDGSQLASGDFGSVPSLGVEGSIDVFAAGFELSGTRSSLDSFAAAVPEPTTGLMGLLGFFSLLGLRRRRNG